MLQLMFLWCWNCSSCTRWCTNTIIMKYGTYVSSFTLNLQSLMTNKLVFHFIDLFDSLIRSVQDPTFTFRSFWITTTISSYSYITILPPVIALLLHNYLSITSLILLDYYISISINSYYYKVITTWLLHVITLLLHYYYLITVTLLHNYYM